MCNAQGMTIAIIRNGHWTTQMHRHSMRRTVSEATSINQSPEPICNMQHLESLKERFCPLS